MVGCNTKNGEVPVLNVREVTIAPSGQQAYEVSSVLLVRFGSGSELNSSFKGIMQAEAPKSKNLLHCGEAFDPSLQVTRHKGKKFNVED